MVQQFFDFAGTAVLVSRPFVSTALQGLDGALLCRVTLKAFGSQFGRIGLDYGIRQGEPLYYYFDSY